MVMPLNLKCPKCGGKMEEGFVMDAGQGRVVNPSHWIEGKPERSMWFGTKIRGKAKHRVASYRCQKCAYLESYAPEER